MRWFKHLTNAHNDEALAELMEEFGPEGYGIWWLVLEKIAAQMDKSGRCFARYSLKKWAKTCQVSVKKFQKVVSFLAKLDKFSVEVCQKNSKFLIIECANLLKFRDEYSKKSGQTPDRRRIKSGESPDQETETETETENILPQKSDLTIKSGKAEADSAKITHTEEKERKSGTISGGNESSPPEPAFSQIEDYSADPKIQAAFKKCLDVLGMSEQEMIAAYQASSDNFAEAVQVAIEATKRLMRDEDKLLDRPGAFIISCAKRGVKSKQTRKEAFLKSEKVNGAEDFKPYLQRGWSIKDHYPEDLQERIIDIAGKNRINYTDDDRIKLQKEMEEHDQQFLRGENGIRESSLHAGTG